MEDSERTLYVETIHKLLDSVLALASINKQAKDETFERLMNTVMLNMVTGRLDARSTERNDNLT